MKTWYEKLKDPKWQRKRLKVMEEAEFKCENCYDSDKTLNVHHGYYEKGLDPWDYDSKTLWCLCEDCHTQVMDELRDLHFQLGKVSPDKFSDIIRFIMKCTMNDRK